MLGAHLKSKPGREFELGEIADTINGIVVDIIGEIFEVFYKHNLEEYLGKSSGQRTTIQFNHTGLPDHSFLFDTDFMDNVFIIPKDKTKDIDPAKPNTWIDVSIGTLCLTMKE